jgi:hypothetical protein
LSESKYKYWFVNKYSKVKMYKKDDKEAIKNAIMKFAVIDEAPAFPEIFFQKFNDKIKIVFDYDIKVVECMKNIPVTPNYNREAQLADLTTLINTLWIVIEYSPKMSSKD